MSVADCIDVCDISDCSRPEKAGRSSFCEIHHGQLVGDRTPLLTFLDG